MIQGGRLYTGPLSVAAATGTVNGPKDSGEHTIILLGLAIDCAAFDSAPIRVRMEMTPEDAEDLARSLLIMARAAKEKKR
jgi:hypothetical protein